MPLDKIHDSSGNVFIDLGVSPDEAAILSLRAELMVRLSETIAERHWMQADAATVLGVAQSRVSDLVRSKWDKFSLDMLVTLTTRTGRRVSFAVA